MITYTHAFGTQFASGKGVTDKERVKALRQQAKDFAILLKNLDRQKVREEEGNDTLCGGCGGGWMELYSFRIGRMGLID